MLIDIILGLLIIYGFFIGYSKGIIKTILYALAVVIGIVAGIKFAPAATSFLEGTFNFDSPLAFVAGFLSVFLFSMLLIRLVAKGIEGVLKTGHINFVNKIIGGALTAAFFTFLYSAIVMFADSSNLINEEAKQKSFSYEYLRPFQQKSFELAKTIQPAIAKYWSESMRAMDRLKEKAEEKQNNTDVFDTPSSKKEEEKEISDN